MLPTSLSKGLSAVPKKVEKVDDKKFSDFCPSQGLNRSLYQSMLYKLTKIFFTMNSLGCQWTSDGRNVSITTNRFVKQCRMSALSFENSTPSHKNYGENRIMNRGCLAKQCATRFFELKVLLFLTRMIAKIGFSTVEA